MRVSSIGFFFSQSTIVVAKEERRTSATSHWCASVSRVRTGTRVMPPTLFVLRHRGELLQEPVSLVGFKPRAVPDRRRHLLGGGTEDPAVGVDRVAEDVRQRWTDVVGTVRMVGLVGGGGRRGK